MPHAERNVAPQVFRQGVTETLVAPGLQPIPAVSAAAQQARQLMQSLGLVGDIAGQIGQAAERKRAQHERDIADIINKIGPDIQAKALLGEHIPAFESPEIQALASSAQAKVWATQEGDTFWQRTQLPESDPQHIALDPSADPMRIARDYLANAIPDDLPLAAKGDFAATFFQSVIPKIRSKSEEIRRNTFDELATSLASEYSSATAVGERTLSGKLAKVVEIGKALGLTEKEVLARVVLPAIQAARNSGSIEKVGRLNAIIEGVLPDTAAAELRMVNEVKNGQVADRHRQFTDQFYADLNANVPPSIIRERVAAATDIGEAMKANMFGDLDRIEAGRLSGVRKGREDQLELKVFNGVESREAVEKEIRASANLPPENPNWVDPSRAGELIRKLGAADDINAAEREVSSALAGSGTVLTDARHGAALAKAIRTFGFDANGGISNGLAITATLKAHRILPSDTAQLLIANLTGPVAEQRLAAAQAIGPLADTAPGIFAKLQDAAGPETSAVLVWAAEASRRGQLASPSAPAALAQAIALSSKPTNAPTAEDVKRAFGAQRSDDIATLNINKVIRDKYEQATVGWNPSVDTSPGDIVDFWKSEYVRKFTELSGKGLTQQAALDAARTYATARFQEKVDIVRWNGVVYPVFNSSSEGLVLPDDARWSKESEEEAIADLKEKGIDPADVAGWRPFWHSNPKKSGWQAIGTDGQPLLRDIENNNFSTSFIYIPTTQAAKAEQERLKNADDIDAREKVFVPIPSRDDMKFHSTPFAPPKTIFP